MQGCGVNRCRRVAIASRQGKQRRKTAAPTDVGRVPPRRQPVQASLLPLWNRWGPFLSWHATLRYVCLRSVATRGGTIAPRSPFASFRMTDTFLHDLASPVLSLQAQNTATCVAHWRYQRRSLFSLSFSGSPGTSAVVVRASKADPRPDSRGRCELREDTLENPIWAKVNSELSSLILHFHGKIPGDTCGGSAYPSLSNSEHPWRKRDSLPLVGKNSLVTGANRFKRRYVCQ